MSKRPRSPEASSPIVEVPSVKQQAVAFAGAGAGSSEAPRVSKIFSAFGAPPIKLQELFVGDETQRRALLATTTEIDTGALICANIKFDASNLSAEEKRHYVRKALPDLLKTIAPLTDCRRGRTLFIDPDDENSIVLSTYQLHRTTSVAQTMEGFVASVDAIIEKFTSKRDPIEILGALNDFYFQSLGISIYKYLDDNPITLPALGINKSKLDAVSGILREIATTGKKGAEYLQAILAADILMQQGELVAPEIPMRDFWDYALLAGVPMGKPTPVPGRPETFSSVISLPGYNSVEHLHPAYAVQITARLGEFIASVRKTAAENEQRPRIIDAGPCTGTILVSIAEMFADIEFIAVEPDGPSCQVLSKALEMREIRNVKIVQKCMQDVDLHEDLGGQKISGMYSSFAAHHMPLPLVLKKLNEISNLGFQVLITDEWTASLGNQAVVRKELLKYHMPIVMERCKLGYGVDLEELRKSDPRITEEQVRTVEDFNRDATRLFYLICEDRDDEALAMMEQMKSYNERYADIFEAKSKGNDREALNPTIAILLFGIQEFAALHQGAMHYREEHKGPLKHFLDMAERFGMYEVEKSLKVLGVSPEAREGESGIYASRLVGNCIAAGKGAGVGVV
jgi:hypothetical protein